MDSFKIVRLGYKVGSIFGILSKVKWGVFDLLFKKYDIKYNKEMPFYDNKRRMIYELIAKLDDKKIRKLLYKLQDNQIQPAKLKKFKQNRDKALYENLLMYDPFI